MADMVICPTCGDRVYRLAKCVWCSGTPLVCTCTNPVPGPLQCGRCKRAISMAHQSGDQF